MPLSNEPDPYSMQHYNKKFQVMLGHQAHNARRVMTHAKAIGRFQNMYRVPLEKNKIEEIMKKTGYVQHGDQLVKKSHATKVRKEAARELRRRQGKPVVGGHVVTKESVDAATTELETFVTFHGRGDHTDVAHVRRLLAAGADVREALGYVGQNIIFEALGNKMWNVAMLLMDHGDVFVTYHNEEIDPHAPYQSDTTLNGSQNLLMVAAFFGAPRAVLQKLLDKGLDIDARDSEHRPALEWAIIGKHAHVATFLLERGANPYLAKLRLYREYRGFGPVLDIVQAARNATLPPSGWYTN